MNVKRYLKGLILLGLLGLAGIGTQTASAQALHGVRIGLTSENVQFFVDGQLYTTTQFFLWPEGSSHIVQFPHTLESDGTVSPFQYFDANSVRYAFQGWVATGDDVEFDGGPVQRIVVNSKLIAVTGTVELQYRVDLEFDRVSSETLCAPTLEAENIDRHGVIYVDDNCYANTNTLWLTPGFHNLKAYAYPGFIYTGIAVNDVLQAPATIFKLNVTKTATWRPAFTRAKRVRFSTTPVNLEVLVDRTPLQTAPTFRFDLVPENNGPGCAPQFLVPIKTPLGIPPLCVGDFEFLPGSKHVLAANIPQMDGLGARWVFDHFSNGLGQNGIYETPSDVENIDQIVGVFVEGVPGNILTDPPGLTIEIDGTALAPESIYGFWWGYGQTHRINAPLVQKDKNGRAWKFVSWSDGGPANHTVTVVPGSTGLLIRAHYESLGQIKVTSNPNGMTLTFNGTPCTTPCTLDEKAGTKLTMVAPQYAPITDASRLTFDRWADHPGSTTLEATFNDGLQFFHTDYHTEHLFMAYTDPEDTGTFKFVPGSLTGYYREGEHVQITIQPKTGSKFLAWRGDVESRNVTESFDMLAPVSVVAHMEKVPVIKPAGIQNAAGDNPNHTVAPGSIITIYGENLTIDTKVGPTNPLAQTIADMWVTVDNGSILPLMFVSPTQINAQLMSTVSEGDHTLTVHSWGQPDVKGTFKVKRNSPGVFFTPTKDGMPLVAALHEDGKLVTQENPARRGEVITFFGTGLSPYNRPVIDGFPLSDKQSYELLDPVKVLLQKPIPAPPAGVNPAELPAPPPPAVRDPQFVAGTAGLVGLTTVQVKIDTDLPAGNVLELFLSVKDNESNRVQIPVE